MNNPNPFSRPSSGGSLQNKDYTKFVKWTPKRITVFVISISIPYLLIIYAVASVVGIMATVPFLILTVLVGAIAAIMYWLANATL